MKTGDAKLWVYRCGSSYDCQAAESYGKQMLVTLSKKLVSVTEIIPTLSQADLVYKIKSIIFYSEIDRM